MTDKNDLQAWLDFRGVVESLILDKFRETPLNDAEDVDTLELAHEAIDDAAAHGIYWRFVAILDHVYSAWVSLPLSTLQHYGETLVYAAWNYVWAEIDAADQFVSFAQNVQSVLMDLADRCDEKGLDADRCERAKLRLLHGVSKHRFIGYMDWPIKEYFIAAKDGGKYDK